MTTSSPTDITEPLKNDPIFRTEVIRISLAERLLKLCPKDKSFETICKEAGITDGRPQKFLAGKVDFALEELVKIGLILNRGIDITFPALHPMPLPPNYERISGVIVEFNKFYWRVTMESLIMTGYNSRSRTMDRLFRFEEISSGQVMYMTGHAYDQAGAVNAKHEAKKKA